MDSMRTNLQGGGRRQGKTDELFQAVAASVLRAVSDPALRDKKLAVFMSAKLYASLKEWIMHLRVGNTDVRTFWGLPVFSVNEMGGRLCWVGEWVYDDFTEDDNAEGA